MIFFGEKSLRNAVREYLAHFQGERPHQGMGHRILEAGGGDLPSGRTDRLSGTDWRDVEVLSSAGGVELIHFVYQNVMDWQGRKGRVVESTRCSTEKAGHETGNRTENPENFFRSSILPYATKSFACS